MHFNHFSKDLISFHVWRQAQTQSTIINFYEADFNILNPTRNERGAGNGIFRMEFPLMQWLVAGVYKLCGNHLILSRVFMFITGLFSVWGIYQLLLAIFKIEMLALIGAWAFNFSPSFYYYTINPLPDNFALCCSIWGLALFFMWINKKTYYLLLSSGLLLSIGALCKLPFILYFTCPFIYFLNLIIKNGYTKSIVSNLLTVSGFILFPLAWYFSVIPQWQGNGVVNGILDDRASTSTIIDYMQHNLFSTLPELLINYGSLLFFLSGFYFLIKNKSYKNSLFPLFISLSFVILMYFFFEINMIAKVHDYYLFPFYPLIFILVAHGAYNILISKQKFYKFIVVFLLLILPVTANMRMRNRWNIDSPGFNKDLLIYKNDLQNAVPKNALCIAGNDESHFIFLYYIDKKGWGFNEDDLNAKNLKKMIGEGAQYIYSDSRIFDTNPEITPFLDNLILEKGSIKVYHLKNKIDL